MNKIRTTNLFLLFSKNEKHEKVFDVYVFEQPTSVWSQSTGIIRAFFEFMSAFYHMMLLPTTAVCRNINKIINNIIFIKPWGTI